MEKLKFEDHAVNIFVESYDLSPESSIQDIESNCEVLHIKEPSC